MTVGNLAYESTKTKNQDHSQPKVSIILPVYNAGEFLRPCLDTLVNQTLREIEIICVLDCPTDGSDKVVEEYAEKDNRIVVIRNEHNLHIGESRNVGIRTARGEYIGFSDHDDTHELDMYEKLYQQTSNGSKDVVLSGSLAHFLSSNNHTKSNDVMVDWAMTIFLNKARLWLVTTHIYKKDFLSNNNLYFGDTKQFNREDALFNLHVLCTIKESDSIAIIDKDFYNRILHNNNESSNPEHISFQKTLCFLSKIYNLLKNGQSNLSSGLCDYGISELTIRLLYSQFRDDIKVVGLKQSVFRIEQSLHTHAFLMNTVKNTSLSISPLPLTKRIFLLIMKLKSTLGGGRNTT